VIQGGVNKRLSDGGKRGNEMKKKNLSNTGRIEKKEEERWEHSLKGNWGQKKGGFKTPWYNKGDQLRKNINTGWLPNLG